MRGAGCGPRSREGLGPPQAQRALWRPQGAGERRPHERESRRASAAAAQGHAGGRRDRAVRLGVALHWATLGRAERTGEEQRERNTVFTDLPEVLALDLISFWSQ